MKEIYDDYSFAPDIAKLEVILTTVVEEFSAIDAQINNSSNVVRFSDYQGSA